MTEYKKIETTPKVCTFQEMTQEEVEDEVLAAVEEGKKKIAKLESEIVDLKEQLKPRPKPLLNKCGQGVINDLRTRNTPEVNRTCACCTKCCSIPEEITQSEEFCKTCWGR